MTEYRLPPDHCITCGATVDACAEVMCEKDAPFPGAVTICIYCATVQVFDDNLRLRKPTPLEAHYLEHDSEIQYAVTRTKDFISKQDKLDGKGGNA